MPFTTEEFLSIFESYNIGVFPVQFIFLALVLAALAFLRSRNSFKNYFINSVLIILWLWNGIVYHFMFFTKINPAANIFAAIFIIQALLLVYSGFIKKNLNFQFSGGIVSYTGLFIIIFGLLIYPFIGYLILQDINKIISGGLPCPSVIITFGFFLLSTDKFPKYLLILPTIWALIGFTAVLNFGIYPDTALLIFAVIADIYLLRRKR